MYLFHSWHRSIVRDYFAVKLITWHAATYHPNYCASMTSLYHVIAGRSYALTSVIISVLRRHYDRHKSRLRLQKVSTQLLAATVNSRLSAKRHRQGVTYIHQIYVRKAQYKGYCSSCTYFIAHIQLLNQLMVFFLSEHFICVEAKTQHGLVRNLALPETMNRRPVII